MEDTTEPTRRQISRQMNASRDSPAWGMTLDVRCSFSSFPCYNDIYSGCGENTNNKGYGTDLFRVVSMLRVRFCVHCLVPVLSLLVYTVLLDSENNVIFRQLEKDNAAG